jgi:hypothetical protein
MAVSETSLVQVRTSGVVPAGMDELAKSRVETVLRHIGEPVLSVRVMLSRAAGPTVERPAIAWAIISVNGRVVRASGVGPTMREAIAQLAARLAVVCAGGLAVHPTGARRETNVARKRGDTAHLAGHGT